MHPFGKREHCPVVTADYVTKEDGTGLVHTAPGHGQDDFQTGLRYNLPVLMPVNSKGVFTDEGAPFTGQHVFKANEQIIADLKDPRAYYLPRKIFSIVIPIAGAARTLLFSAPQSNGF